MRNIGGVLLPDLEEGSVYSLRDQIMLNAPSEAKKDDRRREAMRKQIRKEWDDRRRTSR